MQLLYVLWKLQRYLIELQHSRVICSYAYYGLQCLVRLHSRIQALADPERHAALDKRPFFMAQDVIAKDEKDEKEKENRKGVHLLECTTSRKRGHGKKEM